MFEFIQIKPEFKSNIYAHGFAFILNMALYAFTHNFFFIWVELATLAFIGYNNTKSQYFFDLNIWHHFISVMLFYLLADLAVHNHSTYLILIFCFTFCFFILKDNGYNKSNQIWLYIQALLFGTTFITFPFEEKMLATVGGFVEAQILLNIGFYLFKTSVIYEKEKTYLYLGELFKNKFWRNNPTIPIAIRGALSAAILYAICIQFSDEKPNWAVVVTVACLFTDNIRNTYIIALAFILGGIIGIPVALIMLKVLAHEPAIAILLLWLLLILTLIFSFENISYPKFWLKVKLVVISIAVTACIMVALKITGYNFAEVRIINCFAGGIMAIVVNFLWQCHRWIGNRK